MAKLESGMYKILKNTYFKLIIINQNKNYFDLNIFIDIIKAVLTVSISFYVKEFL
jgi:hypothetical protein